MWEMIAAWSGSGRPLRASIDDIVAQHGGVIVSDDTADENTTAAYFRSVREALDAALDVVAADTEPPSCSIGIAAGEVEMDDECIGGPPLDEARRLAAGDDPGVFVTETTRALAPDERYLFERCRRSGSAPITQLVGHRTAARSVPGPTLPYPIAAEPEFALIGRAEELALLDEAFEAVAHGQHRELVLGGEAGSGKSRLMREYALEARRRGATVLYGRCQEAAERPFLPFADALSHYLDQLPAADRAVLLTSIEDDLAPLLAVRPGPSADPETDQHWMLQSVSTLLTRMAEQRPVLLITEDVHLAGRPTRTLLRHLADISRPSGLLMVVTYRDAPSDLDGEGGALIEGIGRASTARRRAIRPLDRDEVAEIVRAPGDLPIGDIDANADLLYARTGGNPLLTVELWLHLRRLATDPELSSAVPASIIELATRQLHALPPASRSVVELGATMGPEIDLELLAAVLDCDVDEIVSRAMPAVQARLLIEDRPGRLRFVHELIADSVVHSLPLDVRLRHHRSFVGAIDQQAEPDLMLVAHHALSAVPLVPAEEALRRSALAAEAAMQSVAFGDAITVLERALELNVSGSRRAELLLAHARAAAIAGDASRCVEACGEAAALAREHGDRSLLREAAFVAGESIWIRTPTTTAGAISLLEEAVASTSSTRDRSRLLAALTSISALAGNAVRSVECGEEALRLAREVGEPALLLDALHRNMFRELRPGKAEAHLELTREAVTLADQVGDDRLTVRILAKTLLVLTVVCEPEWLAFELERFDRLAHRLREPLYLMTNEGFRTMRAVSEGRLQEAEAIAEDANRTWTNQTGYGLQMFSIRREQNRIAELRPVLEVGGSIEGAARLGAWGPGLAIVYAEVGMVSEAQSLLTDLVNDDLAMVARDSLFPGVLSYLSDVATAVGDQGAAARIHDHLVPYEGMLVTFPGVVSHGSADRYLGRLCETMGRVRAAREHFERAVEVDERLGWTTWAAHSRYELGRHLVETGKRSDSSAGFAHLRRAHRMARSGRLVALARRCQNQLGGSGDDRGSNLLTRRELEVLEALAEGRTNREIGERIHASRHTVANHVRAILAKTGTANRTEAARWAYQRGLVRADGVPAVE